MNETLTQFFSITLIIMASCFVLAISGLILMIRSIRRIRVPPDADFLTTMHYIPLPLVVLLDLLDFSLDIFSAPISWIILDRMGLPNLRNKAAIEGLLPFTGPIPTFTIAWLVVRLFNLQGVAPSMYRPSYTQTTRHLNEAQRPYVRDYVNDRRRPPPRVIDMDE